MDNPMMLPQQPGMVKQPYPISQDELYATQMNEDKIRNIISQISPDNQLLELQWRLKGYIYDTINQEWVKIEKDVEEPSPLMVSRYVSYASSIINQNTILSTLQPEEINSIMKMTIEWFVDDMDAHAEIYGIKSNYTERTRIGMVLLNFIFIVLKRCQGGMESKRMWAALSLTESQNPTASLGDKKGLMKSLRDWKI